MALSDSERLREIIFADIAACYGKGPGEVRYDYSEGCLSIDELIGAYEEERPEECAASTDRKLDVLRTTLDAVLLAVAGSPGANIKGARHLMRRRNALWDAWDEQSRPFSSPTTS